MVTKGTSSAKSRKSAKPVRDATREDIMLCAAHLMRDQGYAMTTLRQIADAAGIKAASIYYHVASKDDLLLQVLDMGLNMVAKRVRESVDSLGPKADNRSRLRAAVRGHLQGLLGHGDFISANIRVYSQLPEAVRRKHRIVRRAYARYWDKLLQDGRDSGELRTDIPLAVLRMSLLGMLNWTIEWFDGSESSIDEFSAYLDSILFDGMARPPKPTPAARRPAAAKKR